MWFFKNKEKKPERANPNSAERPDPTQVEIEEAANFPEISETKHTNDYRPESRK